MVCHHHFRFLNFPTSDKKRAFAIVVTVAVEAAGFVGTQTTPEIIIYSDILQLRTTFLLFLIVRRQFVVKKRQQILLRGLSAGERCQITRANVAPTPKSGSEFKIGNDLFQQR